MPADSAVPSDERFRFLIIGDVVGRPGRRAVKEVLPQLKRAWGLDLVICNAENSASGSGITPRLFRELRDAGCELMTLGDHAWKRRENLEVLEKEELLLRPHNYPEKALGRGVLTYESASGVKVGLITVLGRVFMPAVDCPFATIDAALASFDDDVKIRVVEIHAEATSEKIAVGWHLDGRATCVFGTHTHVPTADERVLPRGTGFICDLGMTGPYDGVIGRDKKPVLHKFLTSMHATFTVAEKEARFCGVLVDADRHTGKAISIRRVDIPVPEPDSEELPPGALREPALQRIEDLGDAQLGDDSGESGEDSWSW